MSRENRYNKLISLNTSVHNLLRKEGYDEIILLNEIRAHWKLIAGDLLAAKTQPVLLKNGVLTVSTPHNGYNYYLKFRKKTFLDYIRVTIQQNAVRDIRFIYEWKKQENAH